MVRFKFSQFPFLLLLSVTMSAYKYKLLLVWVLLVYSSPNFIAIDQRYFSFTDNSELQQTGHHKTLHLRSPKLPTENSFSANTAKYWEIAGLHISPSKHVEALNPSCTIVNLLLEKYRTVQKTELNKHYLIWSHGSWSLLGC